MFHVKQKRVAFRSLAGACLLCRRLTLPLVYFSAPIPPAPRSQSALPGGKGEIFGLFCRGLAPPAPLLLNLRGAGLPEGFAPCIPVAKPARRWLFLPRQCFLPPSPSPLPGGKGGDFRLFYARGFAPCIPGAKPARRWLFLPRQCFLPPSPSPLPGGKGGDFRLFYARGFAPCIPGAKPGRHWLFLPRQCFLPPSPCPLPGGKGELFVLFCRGLAPPGTPAAKPARCWLAGRLRPLHPRG